MGRVRQAGVRHCGVERVDGLGVGVVGVDVVGRGRHLVGFAEDRNGVGGRFRRIAFFKEALAHCASRSFGVGAGVGVVVEGKEDFWTCLCHVP